MPKNDQTLAYWKKHRLYQKNTEAPDQTPAPTEPVPAPIVHPTTEEGLMALKVVELRKIARTYELQGYSKYSKLGLAKAIVEHIS